MPIILKGNLSINPKPVSIFSGTKKYEGSSKPLVFFESHPLPTILVLRSNLKIVSANKAATALLQLTAQELLLRTFTDILIPADKVKTAAALQRSKEGAPWNTIVQLQKTTQEILTADMHVQTLVHEADVLHQITLIDITSRYAKQEQLAATAKRYKGFIDQNSEGIFCQELLEPMPVTASVEAILDAIKESCLTECNDALAQMYGYEYGSQMVGLVTKSLVDFSDEANIEYVKGFITNDFKVVSAESHEKDRFGNSVYFLNNAIGIVENGFLKRIWGSQRDITQIKEVEKKVRLLADLVEQTSDVLTAADLDFKPLTWNTAAEKVYGLSAQQVIGKNVRQYIDIHYHNTTREEVRAQILKEGGWRGEMSFIRPTDQKLVTLLTGFKLMKDDQDEPLGYIISGTDITERKEAELLLQESEGRFRELGDSAPVGIWMISPEDKVVYVNRYLEKYTGYTTSELLGSSWANLIHPEQVKDILVQFEAHFKKRLPVTVIYKLKRGDGQYRWVQDTGIPRFLEDGTFLGYIGSVIDIDDTKKKEEQLQYQAMVLENVRDSIIVTDLEFSVLSMNKVAEEVYECKEEEAIGRFCYDIAESALVSETEEDVQKALAEKGFWIGETSIKNKKGEFRYFRKTINCIYDEKGDRKSYLFISHEITDRKRAEEKVLQSESFYRSLIANSLDGMLLVDPDTTIRFVFPSIYNVLGYESEDMLGKSALDFVHPDDVAYAFSSFQDTIIKDVLSDTEDNKRASDIQFVVIRVRKKNGNWTWCMVRGHSQLHNPHINSIVIYLHDDSLRKKANDALAESEERFRHMIQDLQVGVILQDEEGKVEMVNHLAAELLGGSEEKLKGKFFLDIIPTAVDEQGNPVAPHDRPVARVIKTGKPVRGIVLGIFMEHSSEQKWMMVDVNPIFNEEGKLFHIITSLTDITQRKKLENKLRFEEIYHQRLLAQATIDGQEKERREIGKELHDNIGQQLTTTKLYLDLAKSTVNAESQEMVGLALRSVSDVINEIRDISRSLMPPTLGDLGLVESISDLIETLARTQTLEIKLDDSRFNEAKVPDNQKLMLFRIIQEQLNNVVKHARAQQVEITLENNASAIFLKFADDGIGFDLARVRKGLGLANIQNRVELFAGRVEIITAEGQGCIIKVTVPIGLPNLPQNQ